MKTKFSQIYSIAELFSFLRGKACRNLTLVSSFFEDFHPSLGGIFHFDRSESSPPLIKHLRVSLSFYFGTFQGMIYLHDSVIKYHGSLSTSNCLVDSRWVVKLADFGLHEFKKNAECEPCDVMKKYHGKRNEYTNLHWTIKK